MGLIKANISTNDLDVHDAVRYVTDAGHGAIDTFIGTVRDNHNGKAVTGITYDIHKDLAEQVLHRICEEAQDQWPETKYYVSHYHGSLTVGGISIIIAVSSPHRAESFEACRYVIEEIKKRAPVWKKEHYTDGISDWLSGHSLTANG